MCRLFGIVANKEVDIDFSFKLADRPFKSFSKNNPDGWGIGYYDVNDIAKVEKEGLDEVGDIKNYSFSKVSSIKSKIIISHVRKATCGSKTKLNSHPFQLNKWIFAHNGSVNRKYLLEHLKEDYKELIKGETDSEVYFLLLMQEIERNKENIINGIRSALEIVYDSENYAGLNFIMSDGQNLYAYRDAQYNIDYYSLYFLRRNPKDGIFSYLSDKTRQFLHSKVLLNEEAVLICSEKLTNENWEEVPPKTLLIVNSNLEILRNKL